MRVRGLDERSGDMARDYKAEFGTVVEESKLLGKVAGEQWKAFGGLHHAVMQDGALDRKTKELIALGMSIAMRCEGCILSHARGAVKAGATQEELAEMAGVAMLLAGGPGSVYGGKALAAAEQFAAA